MKSTSRYVYDELIARGIDVRHQLMGENSFFAFQYNNKLRTMSGVSTDLSSSTARTICNNKDVTVLVADMLGYKMPATVIYDNDEKAIAFLNQYNQIVVKPADNAHGNGVTINVNSPTSLTQALQRAREYSRKGGIILQQQVIGSDYRILVIDGTAIAVSQRTAASIVGDGIHTNAELIKIENKTNSKRGSNYEKPLNYIDVSAAQLFLGEKMQDIPEQGKENPVVGTANMGTGGKATNRTGQIPDTMIKEAERIVCDIGAFTCGVDFMYDNKKDEWFLIELNSSPSFGLHHSPSDGGSVDVTRFFVDRLLARYDV
ncbi:hypothetical protein H7X68_02265 [Candidatus Saccharibacteria bacterium]|nr:hypothetical protein [Candidatus Saccharibacteria bacterium]